MNRTLAILLTLLLLLGLSACAPSQEPPPETQPTEYRDVASVYYLNDRPELHDTLQELASEYTRQTGIEVKLLTPASGTYYETLAREMTRPQKPTLFTLSASSLPRWDDWALDLADTALAGELTVPEFALYNKDGAMKAIGNSYASYGLMVNTELLAAAGYELADIRDFESLKAAAEDITARTTRLGFGAFTPAGLDKTSSHRFTAQLAALPLHYEGVAAPTPEITGQYLPLYRNVWDLYIQNASYDPQYLSACTQSDALAMFAQGMAVFHQDSLTVFSQLAEAGMDPDTLAVIPLYCGAEGEDRAALCSDLESTWAINARASAADQQATADFLLWLVTDPEALAAYAGQVEALPFRSAPESGNPLVRTAAALLAAGKAPISWAHRHTPNPDSWRMTMVTALAAYSAAPTDANWHQVEGAFVDGWAYEYLLTSD